MREELLVYAQTGPLEVDADGHLKMTLKTTFLDVPVFFAAAANIADRYIYVAPYAVEVSNFVMVWATAETTATALTATLRKQTGTQTPAQGTDLLQAAINLKGTANTPATGSLITTQATLQLAAGDRLSIDFANTGTITEIAGLLANVSLKKL